MSGRESRRKLERKALRKSLDPYERIRTLEAQLARAEKKVFQYELSIFLKRRIEDAERTLGTKFDDKNFDDKMRSIYDDADEMELMQKDFHYRIWQYIIHFQKGPLDCLETFQSMYSHESKRQECHEFCLSLALACKLYSSRVYSEQLILGTKISYFTLTKKQIYKSLNEVLLLGRLEIANILKFLEIWDKIV